ncbi:hypothetical protein BASA83_010035 [Batrachochytrium salamandrivorans]|nr:hypothetical protein BASA81_011397 [Batrachochytrium salamandrivorans]KAH9267301.1 hypothetical protein BASA83_010035 [Batrachochytrium salamandrivorans]
MRLISFAMVSLLAITVSAQPPHNPDTDAMDEYLNDFIQNMEEPQGIFAQSIEELMDLFNQDSQQLLNDITQNSQQPQDAGTQSVQQSPDATTQNAHQSQESDDQILDQFLYATDQIFQHLQNSATQNLDQSQGAATQSEQQSQGAATQNMHRSQGAATQSKQQYQGIYVPNMHQSQSTITQSAKQFQGISVQNMHQSLDATTQSAQQSDQDKVLTEVERLTKALKIRNKIFSQIDSYINTEKQRDAKVKDMIKKITMKLRETGLSRLERRKLEKKSYDLRMVSDELTYRKNEQHQSYINAMKSSNELYAKLQLLKENQELIAEHNFKNVFKVEPSPNSCYNMDMLRKQYDKVLKDIDASLVEQKKLKGAMLLPGGNAFKAQKEEFDTKVPILQSYSEVARRIMWEYMYGQSIGAWISKSLNSYMQNAKII